MAAPIAGTCEEETPAMILATFLPRFAGFARFSRSAAIAFDRPTTAEHHLGVVLLRGAGHDGRHVLEGVPVGRTKLCGEVDIAAQLEHPVVLALEDGLTLFGSEREPIQIF